MLHIVAAAMLATFNTLMTVPSYTPPITNFYS